MLPTPILNQSINQIKPFHNLSVIYHGFNLFLRVKARKESILFELFFSLRIKHSEQESNKVCVRFTSRAERNGFQARISNQSHCK